MKTENSTHKIVVKPWMWIAGTLLILTPIGLVIWHKSRKKKKEEEEEWEDSSGSYTANSSGSSDSSSSSGSSSHRPTTSSRGPFRCQKRSYPLSYGTCHPDVAILQRYLKSLKADLGSSGVDGKFGSMTEKAAKAKTGKSTFSLQDIQGMKRSLNLIKT